MSASTTINSSVRQWKQYPAYKVSGVEWLGSIPSHWNAKRLKHLSRQPMQYGANEAAELNDPACPRFIRITDVTPDGRLREDTFKSLPEDVAEPYFLKAGDLLFARSGATVGKTFLYQESWGRACYAGYLIRFRSDRKQVQERFLVYFCNSSAYLGWLSSVIIQATIQNVSAEKYANLSLSFPPLDEQSRIVAFLDRETAKIDTLIVKKERLIELLQEKRIALISHAVTKGVDPTVPMKDSGVEWLGKIPAHWDVIQSRRVFKVRNEPATESDEQLTASQKYGMLPQTEFMELEGRRVVVTIKGVDSLRHVEPNDFVISLRSFQGGIEWCKLRGSVTFHYVVLKSVKKVYPAYFGHLFKSSVYIQALRATTDFIRDGQDLRYSHFALVPILVIPMEEQAVIASFLDRETDRLDRLIAKVREAIEKLREYRTALISAAVTGKIDVREEVA